MDGFFSAALSAILFSGMGLVVWRFGDIAHAWQAFWIVPTQKLDQSFTDVAA
jgi:hypothetical protein